MEADPGGAYASSSRGIQLPPKRASTTNHHVFPEFSPSKSKKMTPFSVCSIHHVTPWKQVILNPSGQGCQYGTAILLFGQAGWQKITALDPRRPIIKAQVNLGAVRSWEREQGGPENPKANDSKHLGLTIGGWELHSSPFHQLFRM